MNVQTLSTPDLRAALRQRPSPEERRQLLRELEERNRVPRDTGTGSLFATRQNSENAERHSHKEKAGPVAEQSRAGVSGADREAINVSGPADPREFWLLQYPFSIFVYGDPEGAKMQQAAYDAVTPPLSKGEIIRVREVTE